MSRKDHTRPTISLAEPLRRRVALDRPAVDQLEDVVGGDLQVLGKISVTRRRNSSGSATRVDDAGDDGLTVAGVRARLRDLPELRERAVAGGDAALQVGHEDRVGGRIERRLQQRVRALPLGFGLLQRGDVERDGPDEGGLARVVEHDRGADAQPDRGARRPCASGARRRSPSHPASACAIVASISVSSRSSTYARQPSFSIDSGG